MINTPILKQLSMLAMLGFGFFVALYILLSCYLSAIMDKIRNDKDYDFYIRTRR